MTNPEVIAGASDQIVRVVGTLTIEVTVGLGISVADIHAARNALTRVYRALHAFAARHSNLEVDPKIFAVLKRVVGQLVVAEKDSLGVDPETVSTCCTDLAGVHSMLRALAAAIRRHEAEQFEVPSEELISRTIRVVRATNTNNGLAISRDPAPKSRPSVTAALTRPRADAKTSPKRIA